MSCTLRSIVLALVLGGCAATNATAPAGEPARVEAEPASAAATAEPTDKWRRRPLDAGCRTSLTAIVEGRLSAWKGLPVCGRVDAEAVFGSSGDGASRFEQFGEYRVYPRAHDPVVGSVLVWFLRDDIRVLQLTYPRLPAGEAAIATRLGEPEAKLPSLLSQDWEQWVYSSRGLTLHVERKSAKVASLFAYRPMTVEAYKTTDLAGAAKSEDPVESLK